MANLQTAADILKSDEFLEAQENANKYVQHKFQDYGLRLAKDLGDEQHKSIYLRLAKTEDKALLEQAASFALSFHEEANKGKIFMWKLKQAREERRKKRQMSNYEHDFVMQKMGELYSDLADVIRKKQIAEFNEDYEAFLHEFAELTVKHPQNGKSKTKSLVLGSGLGWEANFLNNYNFKVYGLEISRTLVSKAKEKFPKLQFVGKKHFLDNSYKDNYFNSIFVPRLWGIIPLEIEDRYIVELQRIVKPQGVVALVVDTADEPRQEWQKFELSGIEYLRFTKQEPLAWTKNKFTALGWEVYAEKDWLQENKKVLILQK